MTPEQDAQRGEMARQVLENPVYADAHTQIEAEIIRMWRESRDPDERERMHLSLKLLAKVRTALEATMTSGEVSASKLREERSRMQRGLDYLKRA